MFEVHHQTNHMILDTTSQLFFFTNKSSILYILFLKMGISLISPIAISTIAIFSSLSKEIFKCDAGSSLLQYGFVVATAFV